MPGVFFGEVDLVVGAVEGEGDVFGGGAGAVDFVGDVGSGADGHGVMVADVRGVKGGRRRGEGRQLTVTAAVPGESARGTGVSGRLSLVMRCGDGFLGVRAVRPAGREVPERGARR